MSFIIDDLPARIRQAKAEIRAQLTDYRSAFESLQAEMRRRVDEIIGERDAGEEVIPLVQYAELEAGRVSPATIDRIKARGACVIRSTFPREQAEGWNREIADYLTQNQFERRLAGAVEDNYFGSLKMSAPQIYGIYWSRAQVEARQSTAHTTVRQFLNGLWSFDEAAAHLDLDETPVYADRIRRRPPGSASLGLSPHVDGGSVERWLEPNFRKVYRHVYSGDWRHYDPFDATHRPDVEEVASPAVCSMFRTFQGWTALTRQGPGDGTLQLIPIATAMVYVLLRALQDDVADDDLCGSAPGRALSVNPQHHALLIEAVSSIPVMEPGDTVFWHADLIHAVEDDHRGAGFSNVMYIPAAPGCAKNRRYLARQAQAFIAGGTPPDFPQDNFETDFIGRGTPESLTPSGRAQLGLD